MGGTDRLLLAALNDEATELISFEETLVRAVAGMDGSDNIAQTKDLSLALAAWRPTDLLGHAAAAGVGRIRVAHFVVIRTPETFAHQWLHDNKLSDRDVHNVSSQSLAHICAQHDRAKLLSSKQFDEVDCFGHTPLYTACAAGSVAAVRRLLALSCASGLQNYAGNTALHAAASNGDVASQGTARQPSSSGA